MYTLRVTLRGPKHNSVNLGFIQFRFKFPPLFSGCYHSFNKLHNTTYDFVPENADNFTLTQRFTMLNYFPFEENNLSHVKTKTINGER